MNDFVLDGFCWQTYSEVGDKSNAICHFLLDNIKSDNKIGITSNNCTEFIIADFACAIGAFTSVGLHTTYDDMELVDGIIRAETLI